VPPDFEGPGDGGNGSSPGGGKPPDGGGRWPGGGRRRGGGQGGQGPVTNWRWLHIGIAVVAFIVLACVVADQVHLDDYAITPGVARPVGPLVKVPPGRGHRVVGKVLLTDVYVTQLTAFSYLFYKLSGDAQILPAATVLGPDIPAAELAAQGYLEMAQSQEAAKAAALTRLGYHVSAKDDGIVVFAVTAGSPASRALRVGQVVKGVDGTPTPDACAFSRALSADGPGKRVVLSVEQSKVTTRATIEPGRTVDESVTLAAWPSSVPKPDTRTCSVANATDRGFLGIEAVTQEAYTFPFPVTVRTKSIGGPSAGLAMTLGIIDTLSGGRLTGGRIVAATGTIAPTGAVGEVGGIPEKTIAVERAGATVFFVPAKQTATAREKASGALRIFGVRSLTQVLSDLRKLGGTVPAVRGS
jgi:Lon-like protease